MILCTMYCYLASLDSIESHLCGSDDLWHNLPRVPNERPEDHIQAPPVCRVEDDFVGNLKSSLVKKNYEERTMTLQL